VNGKLRCIGGQQHLKSKFEDGIEIELQTSGDPKCLIKEDQSGSVKFEQNSNAFKLIEIYQNTMKIRTQDMKLAEIFEFLERLKLQGLLTSYIVNQTTLEQIFLRLTKDQKSADEN